MTLVRRQLTVRADTDVTLSAVEAQILVLVNQTQTFRLASFLHWLTMTDRSHVMITCNHVMMTSAGAAHAQKALLTRMRSVLPVSFVTHVTENRGRGFVCTGLVVQVKVGLQGIHETKYLLTRQRTNNPHGSE